MSASHTWQGGLIVMSLIPPSSLPSLSIVVPTFNGKDLLRRCLASVYRYRPAGAEVIVVDDASTDGTAEEVCRAYPDVRLLRNDRNQGFCYSANRGWRAAQSEVVELLNNDAEVTADWARASLACFRDPKVGVVAPLVRRLPFRNRIDSAGDLYLWYGQAKKRLEGKGWRERALPAEEVFSASASSAFYRKRALEEVGGFPEEYVAYFDDVDLGWRLRLAGYQCRFEPSSVVFHWVSQSHGTGSRRLLSQVALNSERVFWTNVPTPRLLWLALPHLAYLLTLLAYKALKGEFGPWFAGKLALLTEIPALVTKREQTQSLGRREELLALRFLGKDVENLTQNVQVAHPL